MNSTMRADDMMAAQKNTGKVFYCRATRIKPITATPYVGTTTEMEYRVEFEVSRQLRNFVMTGPADMLVSYTEVR